MIHCLPVFALKSGQEGQRIEGKRKIERDRAKEREGHVRERRRDKEDRGNEREGGTGRERGERGRKD